jgi:signal peptidase II
MAATVVLLDQLSKHWAQRDLPLGEVRPFLPGLLQLQRVTNTGAAFSLFADSTLVLALISTVVSVVVAAWLLRHPPDRPWQALAAGFLLGGAIGNGIDRWRLGAVVDFLEFVPITFPIFNLADVAINLAVACFLLDLLIPSIRSRRRRDAFDRDA